MERPERRSCSTSGALRRTAMPFSASVTARGFSRRQGTHANSTCGAIDFAGILGAEPKTAAPLTNFKNNAQVHHGISKKERPPAVAAWFCRRGGRGSAAIRTARLRPGKLLWEKTQVSRQMGLSVSNTPGDNFAPQQPIRPIASFPSRENVFPAKVFPNVKPRTPEINSRAVCFAHSYRTQYRSVSCFPANSRIRNSFCKP
jgi:hypothetical protein